LCFFEERFVSILPSKAVVGVATTAVAEVEVVEEALFQVSGWGVF
jgi:hypothetical protein